MSSNKKSIDLHDQQQQELAHIQDVIRFLFPFCQNRVNLAILFCFPNFFAFHFSLSLPFADLLSSAPFLLSFYDTKGDNRIRVAQLGQCLRSLWLCPTEAQVAQFAQRWTDPGGC